MANKRIDQPTGTETVGHEWDGIEELNTPLPRWWLWSFYLCIAFALGYTVVYPAWPTPGGGTQGLFGWTSRGQLAQDTAVADNAQKAVRERIAVTPIEQLAANPQLMQQAIVGGRAAFRVNCSQCHGSGAAGSQTLGYPNLNDDDWLWGGDIKSIETTIVHGIRQVGDDQTRQSAMPPFEGVFNPGQIGALSAHVRSLSGKAKANPEGAALFAQNCSVCHGNTGEGGRNVGAPKLNDAIWLYGGSEADVQHQVRAPRMGVMPAWGTRLDGVTIKMLAAYVHSLGGGEAFAPADPAATSPTPTATSNVSH